MNKKIVVILGPTSTGKTSLAIDLCKKFNGEIVSSDSRQVCKYMDVGTGKFPASASTNTSIQKLDKKWIVNDVIIWGYDLTLPGEYFTAYDYAKFSLTKIRELHEDGKRVFLVGGTGFYIDVVTARVKLAGERPDLERRKSLETMPTKNLLVWLTSLNSDVVKEIDTKNRIRIIRALER